MISITRKNMENLTVNVAEYHDIDLGNHLPIIVERVMRKHRETLFCFPQKLEKPIHTIIIDFFKEQIDEREIISK